MDNKSVVVGILIFTLLILGAIVFAYGKQTSKTESIPQYQFSDAEKPAVMAEPASFDFGSIALKDIKKTTFTLENTGAQPLILSDVVTSCGCTSANIIINGETSPTFSMHDNPQWSGTIESNQTALVEVTYDAKVHPVDGLVERFVQIATNDPAQPQVQLSVKANVAK